MLDAVSGFPDTVFFVAAWMLVGGVTAPHLSCNDSASHPLSFTSVLDLSGLLGR